MTVMRFIAEHWLLSLDAALLAAFLGTGGVLLLATRREPSTGRHGRPSGVYHGKPGEIRRHRPTGDRAWPGTFSACVRPVATVHVLDEADPEAVRRWAARYEDTGEITQIQLAVLLSGAGNEPTVERPRLVTA